MGQILVRRLSDEVKERLRQRAKRNGRTLEAEARVVLEQAAQSSNGPTAIEPAEASRVGWGTRLVELQASIGLSESDWEAFDSSLREIRRERTRAVDFES
jgi:plasmid stability protein